VYEAIESRQFLALTLGELEAESPTLVRMHPGAVFADLFAPPHAPAAGEPTVGGGVHLFEAMHRIEAEGRGVVVYVPPPRVDLAHELRALRGGAPSVRDVAADGRPAQREFGLGAQVLVDLGLRRIRIMTNNPRKLIGMAGYGLEVVEQVALEGAVRAPRALGARG
jgi:3,4-dihydroxy 2-butanone 4-phosphate synthase/GTP cyclohydrolase II